LVRLLGKITAPIIRSVKIQQHDVSYRLRFSRRAKYLRLQISRGKELELILPRGIQVKEGEDFLIKKFDWIKKHLSSSSNSKDPGFLLFGNPIIVKQDFDFFTSRHKIKFSGGELIILSPYESKDSIERLYESWLRHHAKLYLKKRAAELANRYGFSVNRISVRDQKTRWGSCSAKKNLNFNFRLLKYRKEIIDYVIVHELCHLKEMNHSKKFWLLVESYLPNYKNLRRELKGHNLA
jgi:predicted metal-dependent hydrolase